MVAGSVPVIGCEFGKLLKTLLGWKEGSGQWTEELGGAEGKVGRQKARMHLC